MTEEMTEDQTPDETPEDITEQEEADETEFSREYVTQLREEAKAYRQKLRDTEARAVELAHRLHAELVRADGRLHNPDDLPFYEDHLSDPDALTAGIDALLLGRPYLARTPKGDVGQGYRGSNQTAPQNFSALLR